MKILKNIFKILAIIIIAIVLIFIFIYVRINVSYKMSKSKYENNILVQGNVNHYVPQGLEYSKKYNMAMQTSYNADHEVSMLYLTNMENGALYKSLKLYKEDDTPNTNHVGGITTNDDKVWITNDYEVSVYSLDEIYNTEESFIRSLETIEIPNRGDFCKYKNNTLWIGDFFLKPFYPVPDDNPLLLGYDVSEEIDYNEPKVIISLPKMVQGMEITEKNEFIFTESFTYLIKSKMEVYSNVLEESPSKYNFNGKEYPYYRFDKSNKKRVIKLPPMAEGMFFKDSKLHILFESSTDKYKFAIPKLKNVIIYEGTI